MLVYRYKHVRVTGTLVVFLGLVVPLAFVIAGCGGGAATGGGDGANQPPVARANADATDAIVGGTVAFAATGSSDPDGEIALYEWDFEGEGSYEWSSTSTGTTEHSYTSEGTYTARLQVTDNDGATDTDTVTISVGEFSGDLDVIVD